LFVVPTAYTLLAGHAHIEAHGLKSLPGPGAAGEPVPGHAD